VEKRKRKKLLSIIIPAYKQENTIKQDILQIIESVEQVRRPYEIIVVVDGQLDKTAQRIRSLHHPKVKATGYKKNKGKGHAVRFGMSKAKGDYIFFIDAGMDLNPNAISMLLAHFNWYKADVIVGSKLHPVSIVNYPWQRKILSWGYRIIVKIFFGLSIRDTQVGIKMFKREVLEKVLPRLLVKNYAFDIEMLAVSHRLGYKRIYEAPVELDFNNASSITSKKLWNIILLMLWDTLAVFYRLKILKYYDDNNKRSWKFDKDLRYRINLP
jgi:glycosyltransferase involved in cell wall biosynthesis